MAALRDDIAAFEQMRTALEANHFNEWVVFYHGRYIDAFPDFESAASAAVDQFDAGPYLIRQVGAPPVQLPAAMIFKPAHAHGSGGV